jgi:hypothetical protein
MTKISFTNEQDQFILSLLVDSDPKLPEKQKWKVIGNIFREQFPKSMKKGKEIKAHYDNSLNPNLNRGPFTNEENQLLLQYLYSFGTQFRRIVMLLKRPENMIKNHFFHHIKKNLSDEEIGKIKKISEEKPFTNNEEIQLLHCLFTFGANYQKISKIMKKIENTIKNDFNNHIKKNLSDEEIARIQNISDEENLFQSLLFLCHEDWDFLGMKEI